MQLFAEILAVDFDVVIPDGERHTNLLMNNAHGKRLVNAFLREDAPALVIGSAVAMTSDGFGDAAVADAITLEANRVTAPADADVNEMIDKFDRPCGIALTKIKPHEITDDHVITIPALVFMGMVIRVNVTAATGHVRNCFWPRLDDTDRHNFIKPEDERPKDRSPSSTKRRVAG